MNSNFAKWSLSQILAIVMLVMAGSAFAAGDALVHNSNNLGTKYGVWGVAGGKYGEFTCTTCHSKNPNNIKRVSDSITAPQGNWSSSKTSSVPVVFNNTTGFGNDAGGHLTSTHVCEVCHSKTSVHRYNSTDVTDLDHQGANNTDCTQCHSHANAFKAQGCTSCHGDATTLVTGQHAAHVNNNSFLGISYGCADCHAKSVTSNTAIKPSPTAHRNGVFGDLSAARVYGTGYVQGSGNCSSYCHTNGKGGLAATTVNWTTGPAFNSCKGCHGGGTSTAGEPVYPSGGAGAADANTHPKHVAATGGAASCQNCHGATMSGTGLNASGKHTDKTIDVLQGNSKTFGYTDASKTCSAASCHGNGFFTPADARWGATLDCKGCHGDTSNAAAKLSGAHNAHLNGGLTTGGIFGCVDCHAPTVTNNTTLKASGGHMNNLLNFSGARAYKTGFNFAAGTCSTYCHTNGRGQAPAVPVTWAGAAIDCGGCHGKDSASMTTGSHQKHLNNVNVSCASCHSLTATTANAIAGAGSTHIDGTVELQQGGNNFNGNPVQFSYAGSLTCNNISCHSAYATPSNTAVWGQVATCSTCHPLNNLSGAHQTHMGALVNDPAVLYNMTANRTPSTNDSVRKYGFGCANCHPMNAANHLNGSVDVDLNRVGVAGVSTLRFLNHSTAAYDKNGTKKCSNMYCHSNASRIEAESNVSSNTSLAWTDSFSNYPDADRCAYCHGNQPTTGAHAAHSVGLHTFNDGVMIAGNIYNGKSGKVPITNKPNTAHGNSNNSTTISCYICHNEVVRSKRNDKNTKCIVCHVSGNTIGASYGVNASIYNLSLHVNGSRNVNFAPIKMLSKAQVRPKGASTTSNSGFDYYSGVWQRTSYKAYSTLSYDIAKNAFDTATMWHPDTAQNSSCTNISCHNGRTNKWNLANFNDPNKCMDCHNAL